MFHPSRRGIYCDLCGEEVLINDKTKEIKYYSINMKSVVARDKMPNDVNEALDMDFCEKCHNTLRERVLKVSEVNNKKRENYGRTNNI